MIQLIEFDTLIVEIYAPNWLSLNNFVEVEL